MNAYEGNDMLGFMLEQGFKFSVFYNEGSIRSIVNVRDTAVIVTDYAVWQARPDYHGGGFSMRILARI